MNQKSNLHLGEEPSQINVVDDTSGVKKLNKNPILIITAVIILLVLALLYAASQRGSKGQSGDTGETAKTAVVQETNKEEFLADLERHGGGQNGVVPPTPLGAVSAPVNVNSDPLADPFANGVPPAPNGNVGGSVPPAPSGQAQKGGNPPNMFEEARREQIMNGLKNGMKALDVPSKTGLATVPPSAPTSSGTTPQQAQAQQANAMSGYIDKIMGMGGMGSPVSGVSADDATKNKNFLKEEPSYDYLYSRKTAQRTPFEVKTGTVIPAVLITGVNSELPGKMKAQISENVYDTATGKYLLIPQGSTLIGDYSSNVVYGQSRVLVAWNRIVFPNGHTLNLGNMNGIDREGYSGFQDEVDNHYFRIFGSAMVMSAITGGIAVSSNNNGNQMTQTPSDQMIASMIDQLGQVGIQMIQKNLNVAPTIMIRSGYKFNVFVTKDMILEPLKIKLR